MSYLDPTVEQAERLILKTLYQAVIESGPIDNTISDSKIVRQTRNKLKVVFRDSKFRCTCAKMTWGMICEVCQGSDRELYGLRGFYRMMNRAKQNNLTPERLQEYVKQSIERMNAPEPAPKKNRKSSV